MFHVIVVLINIILAEIQSGVDTYRNANANSPKKSIKKLLMNKIRPVNVVKIIFMIVQTNYVK